MVCLVEATPVPESVNRSGKLLLAGLIFISLTVFAQTSGIILPDSYRTPLSEIVTENNDWRAPAEEDNPWRKDQKKPALTFRKKAEFFPAFNYEKTDNPVSDSLLQNANELEKPRTNIFKYSF